MFGQSMAWSSLGRVENDCPRVEMKPAGACGQDDLLSAVTASFGRAMSADHKHDEPEVCVCLPLFIVTVPGAEEDADVLAKLVVAG